MVHSIPLSTIWKEMCNHHIDAVDINCTGCKSQCDRVALCQRVRPSGTELTLVCSKERDCSKPSPTTSLSVNGKIHSLSFPH